MSENNINAAVMCGFLSQFKADDSYILQHDRIQNAEVLSDAIKLGLIEKGPRPEQNGASYHLAFRCSVKGRLFVKKHTHKTTTEVSYER